MVPRGRLDAATTLRWLAAHCTPGVDAVADGTYRRLTRGGVLLVEPLPGPEPGVRVAVEGSGGSPDRLPDPDELARVGTLLDLGRDLDTVEADLGADAILGPLVRARPGLRVLGGWSGWETLVRVVVGQQVSVAGARTLAGRVSRVAGSPGQGADTPARVAGSPGQGAGGPDRWFPRPDELARADLGAVGLTGARARALSGLARAVVDGDLVTEPDQHPDGAAGWLADLGRRPGVGPWTLAYLAMRVVHDADAWPAGDLVLRRACAAHGVEPSTAARFRPWRAYAATQLWEATFFAPAGPPAAGRAAGPVAGEAGLSAARSPR